MRDAVEVAGSYLAAPISVDNVKLIRLVRTLTVFLAGCGVANCNCIRLTSDEVFRVRDGYKLFSAHSGALPERT